MKGIGKFSLSTLCLALCFAYPLMADDYDEAFCDKYTKAGQQLDIKPYFYDDYSTILEEAFLKTEDQKVDPEIAQKKILYSKTNKQAVVSVVTPKESFWVFADDTSKDCIYQKNGGQCRSEDETCDVTIDAIGLVNEVLYGTIGKGAPLIRPDHPFVIKKSVKMGDSSTRRIFTTKLGYCSFNAYTAETTVSLIEVLDPTKYTKMDQKKPTVLKAEIRTKKSGNDATFKAVYFTDVKPLSDSQLSNGFGLGETRCGTVKDKFTARKIPELHAQMRYTAQIFQADANMFRAYKVTDEETVYNSKSGHMEVRLERPLQDANEKEVIWEITDYRGEMFYTLSRTYGRCKVQPLKKGERKQPSPRKFWEMNNPNSNYLGVYTNRDIPCDLWHFDAPPDNAEGLVSTRIYTATQDWLKSQKISADFYPVQHLRRFSDKVEYQEIYRFKESPRHYFTPLFACFQAEDTIYVKVTILQSYDDITKHGKSYFELEFGKAILDITGMKSLFRLGFIFFLPNPSAAETEVEAEFSILGKYTGHDDLDDHVYKTDPVTSKQAVDKIRDKIENEEVKFTLKEKDVTVKIKKGSFSNLESGELERRADNSASGYSSGAMAGVALALLIISLALGAAAIFGYKRYSDGGLGPLSFDLSKFTQSA